MRWAGLFSVLRLDAALDSEQQRAGVTPQPFQIQSGVKPPHSEKVRGCLTENSPAPKSSSAKSRKAHRRFWPGTSRSRAPGNWLSSRGGTRQNAGDKAP